MTPEIWEAQLLDRLVRQENGCLVWTGYTSDLRGYAHIGVKGHRRKAPYVHRLAYELWVGPIPEDYEVDHLCFNPSCCEPTHLEAVTHDENMARTRGRKHGPYNVGETCKRGHSREEWTRPGRSTGKRGCILCGRENKRRFRERERAKKGV